MDENVANAYAHAINFRGGMYEGVYKRCDENYLNYKKGIRPGWVYEYSDFVHVEDLE